MSNILYAKAVKGSITGNYASQHTIILPDEIQYDDLFLTETWANLAMTVVQVHDEIIVYPSDSSYRAHLVALAVGHGWAKVREISKVVFYENVKKENNVSDALGKYDVRAMGRNGWSIIRLSDATVIESNLGSRENAEAKLAEFIAANEPTQSV